MFKEGNNLSKGRPKNSVNKVSALVKQAVGNILEEQQSIFLERLEELSPKDYVNAYIGLMKFVVPTLKAQEMQVSIRDEEAPDWIYLLPPEDELKKQLNERFPEATKNSNRSNKEEL